MCGAIIYEKRSDRVDRTDQTELRVMSICNQSVVKENGEKLGGEE